MNKICAAAVLAAVLGGAANGLEAGTAAYSFRQFTAFEAIERTKACGGDVIEFFLWQKLSPEHPDVTLDQNLSDGHIAALKAKLDATGVRAVNAYFSNRSFKDPAGAEVELRKMFEFAKKLGLRGLTGEPPEDMLDLVEKLVREFDIQLCFHNHPKNPARPEYRNWDPGHLLSLMESRDPRMGFSVDTGHYLRSGVDPVDAMRRFGARIHSVHLKDVSAAEQKAPDVRYGKGIGDIPAVLRQLKTQGFRGHIAVEYDHVSDQLMDDVKFCLDFIRSHAGN